MAGAVTAHARADAAARAPLARPRVSPVAEALLVALAVGAAHVALRADPVDSLGVLYDDTVYLALGKAIAEGDGFRSIHLVGAPVHAKFPPGLPLLHAAAWRACGELACVARAAAMLSAASLAAAAGLLWWYGRAVLGNGLAAMLALAGAPWLLHDAVRYLGGAVSEPPFVLARAGALLLADRLARGPDGRRRLTTAVLLGLTLAAATLVRSQGIATVAAVLVALVLARVPWRATTAAAAAAAAPLAAWSLWHGRMLARGPTAEQPDQLPYTAWLPHDSLGELLAFVRAVAVRNTEYNAGAVSFMLLGETSRAGLLLVAGLAALAAAGALLLVRRAPALPLMLAASLAVVTLWPFNQSRFLVPILPFAGLAAAHAVTRALAGRPLPLRLAASAALLLTVATFQLGRPAPVERVTSAFAPAFVERARAVSAWIARETPPGARILVDRGSLFYLRTGRPTAVAWPEEPNVGGGKLFRVLGRYHAERIVADSVDYVVAWGPKGRSTMVHLGMLEGRCPGLLVPAGPVPAAGDPVPSAFWRVDRGRVGCLAGAFHGVRPD